MEKHMQACWFGWAGPIFPYKENEVICWESKVITQLYILLMTGSSCLRDTTTSHTFLSHWDGFSGFDNVFPWLYCNRRYFQWDSSQSAGAKAQFEANLGSKNRKWGQKSKPLPLYFCCQGWPAAAMSPQAVSPEDSGQTSFEQYSLCPLLVLQLVETADILLPIINSFASHPALGDSFSTSVLILSQSEWSSWQDLLGLQRDVLAQLHSPNSAGLLGHLCMSEFQRING